MITVFPKTAFRVLITDAVIAVFSIKLPARFMAKTPLSVNRLLIRLNASMLRRLGRGNVCVKDIEDNVVVGNFLSRLTKEVAGIFDYDLFSIRVAEVLRGHINNGWIDVDDIGFDPPCHIPAGYYAGSKTDHQTSLSFGVEGRPE